MKRFNLLALFVAVCAFASAQGIPSHTQYVKIGSDIPWYTAYNNWQPGTALYSSDSDAAENEQFFISRVKPRNRFVFTKTQVDETMNPDRKMMWWCPIGSASSNWNALPAYYFGGEVYSMWSYTDIYGNWIAPLIQAPAAFLDVCHKNGVRSGTVASVPFGAAPSKNDGGHGSNIDALINGGHDKLLRYLRYYGVDGIGFNSEFSWDLLDPTGFKNLMGNCYSNAASYGVPFNNAWYSFTSNQGGFGDYSVLNSGCVEWFHFNNKKVSDAYFLNYNWGASQLATSQETASGKGRSGFDVYAGMDYQGRSIANWLALQNNNISFGIWGAHNMNMFYESRGEKGADPVQMQKTYQLISENSVTGSSYNPVNTPAVSNILRHTSTATNFHGFSSFITARSTMQAQYGDGTLAGDPFVTYFNLGNGMFFKEDGVTTFNREWYNLGMQDYLPTWRWWWTKNFMGKSAGDASTDMTAEFSWDDAWFGGSSLQISGETDKAYLQLFKTKYETQNNDVFTIRYKVLSGTGSIYLTASTEANPTSELSAEIKKNAVADEDTWVEETIKVSKRGGLKLGDETLAMIGLKFENTSSDFKVLFGEISLTRGTATPPGTPTVKMSKTMATTYKGVDAKIVFDMTSNFSGSRQNYESIYNSDVKTSFYKIYTQQQGEEPVLVTATTSWAAYVVGAPYDVQKGGQFRIGVAAVSMDGKSQSDIAWGNWITVPSSTVIEGFSVDKPIIKAGEEFTVAFDDPTHPAATWVIKASENDAVKGTFNANSFTTSLSEEGIYDLYLTMNGTTEIYRGKIQISPKEVGALPQIKTFAMQGDEIKGNVGEFTYTGREDADGYVSRGLALGEKAFGIPAGQLGFNNNTEFTITFWMYINQFNHEDNGTQFLNVRSPVDQWPESDWGYIWSNFTTEEKLYFCYRLANQAAGDNEEMECDPELEFKPETWYHVAMVCGFTDNRTLTLYINGKLIGSAKSTRAVASWKSSNVIMIGGKAANRAGMDGTIDEVRLYKKALSASEVKGAMQHTKDVSDANFIGYWDFETDSQSDNSLLSIGANKTLKSYLYDPTVKENSNYTIKETTFAAGAPFVSGTNYKIETLPTWKFKGGSIQSATGDKASGEASVSYYKEGIFPATLTLSNGWGTDSKTIDVVVVEPTGIEDVTVEEMQAFPNPFEEEVYVAFAEAGEYVAEVYDYSGRLINSYAVSAAAGEPCKIAIDGEAGVYFIKVKGEAGLLKVMKVIKK